MARKHFFLEMGCRRVFLDAEMTGLTVEGGHRVVEIACVELVDGRITRRKFHRRINPERPIPAETADLLGISDEDLASAPTFSRVAKDFLDYVDGSILVLHYAELDLAFLNMELACAGYSFELQSLCPVIDTLVMAKALRSQKSYRLGALASGFGLEDSREPDGGAVLASARLLARVYQAMISARDQ